MLNLSSKKSVKLINSLLLAFSVVACSTNQINTTSLNNSTVKSNNNQSLDKNFNVKYASGFNSMAYFLTYQDVRNAIKNKTVPDVFYHHHYTQNSEPARMTNSSYLQAKTRLESGDFSEEAYLIANPDIKTAIDAGTIQSGYAHWYSYATTSEPTRKTKQSYLDAKAAIDAGFNEQAYRMAWTDIDNLVKNNTIPNAYTHYHTWARTNETSRVTDARYVKIKNALLEGFEENAYLLAYPDVRTQVTSGFFPKAIDHYINFGLNEGRLERDIYHDAKLAIVNDFDETRYRNAFPDVVSGINLFWFPSSFEHFRRYGRYENRLYRPEYLNLKSELLVNSYTTNTQQNPAIAISSNGNYVITWSGNGTGDTDGGIFAQRYNSAGVAQGSEFRVNTYTTGSQTGSLIAIDNNGNFIISWYGPGTGDTDGGIFAQRYNSAGVAQGSEFRVNTYTTEVQTTPSIATDSNGNFIISWYGPGAGDTVLNGVFAQRYNSSGTAQGSNILVNTYTTGNQISPSITTNSNGNFTITWSGPGTGDTNGGVFAQRYNSAGVAQGSNFLVNTYTTASQSTPSIASDSNANFIITWHGRGTEETTDNGVFAQRYNSAGVAQGSEFLVNTYTTGNQSISRISTDSNGNFFVVWHGEGTGDSYGIYGQRYNSSGVAQGSESRINTSTTGQQARPVVASDNDGNFIVAWRGFGIGDDFGIFTKKYMT